MKAIIKYPSSGGDSFCNDLKEEILTVDFDAIDVAAGYLKSSKYCEKYKDNEGCHRKCQLTTADGVQAISPDCTAKKNQSHETHITCICLQPDEDYICSECKKLYTIVEEDSAAGKSSERTYVTLKNCIFKFIQGPKEDTYLISYNRQTYTTENEDNYKEGHAFQNFVNEFAREFANCVKDFTHSDMREVCYWLIKGHNGIRGRNNYSVLFFHVLRWLVKCDPHKKGTEEMAQLTTNKAEEFANAIAGRESSDQREPLRTRILDIYQYIIDKYVCYVRNYLKNSSERAKEGRGGGFYFEQFFREQLRQPNDNIFTGLQSRFQQL